MLLKDWILALICVLQFIEYLSDGQAAESVHSRIDGKYVLELTDSDFDFSVLLKFRARFITSSAKQQLLDTRLNQLKGMINRSLSGVKN